MFFAWIRNYRPSLGLRISVWYALGIMASFVLIALFASWVTRTSGRLEDRAEIMQEFQQNAARCRQAGSEGFCREDRAQCAGHRESRSSVWPGRTAARPCSCRRSAKAKRKPAGRKRRLQELPRQPGWQNIDGEAAHAAWQVYAEPMPDGYWLQVAKSDRRGRGTRRRLQAALLPIGTLALVICLVGAAGSDGPRVAPREEAHRRDPGRHRIR